MWSLQICQLCKHFHVNKHLIKHYIVLLFLYANNLSYVLIIWLSKKSKKPAKTIEAYMIFLGSKMKIFKKTFFVLKKSICFVVKRKTHPKYPKTKVKKNAFEKYLVYVHWCYLQAHCFCNNIWKLLLGVFVLFTKD